VSGWVLVAGKMDGVIFRPSDFIMPACSKVATSSIMITSFARPLTLLFGVNGTTAKSSFFALFCWFLSFVFGFSVFLAGLASLFLAGSGFKLSLFFRLSFIVKFASTLLFCSIFFAGSPL